MESDHPITVECEELPANKSHPPPPPPPPLLPPPPPTRLPRAVHLRVMPDEGDAVGMSDSPARRH
eukprot:643406-Hanusia_phi.AAC.1